MVQGVVRFNRDSDMSSKLYHTEELETVRLDQDVQKKSDLLFLCSRCRSKNIPQQRAELKINFIGILPQALPLLGTTFRS